MNGVYFGEGIGRSALLVSFLVMRGTGGGSVGRNDFYDVWPSEELPAQVRDGNSNKAWDEIARLRR